MTVSSDSYRVEYSTNGTTGPFTVTFPFLDDTHLSVTYTDSGGAEDPLVLNVDYTLATSQITTTVAYPSGGLVTIQRDIPITQELDLRDGDPFPAESVEEAFDKLTMIAQQARGDISRALRVPEVGTTVPELPAVADRALRLLGFDANGDPVVSIPSDQSAAALALLLASNSLTTQGLGIVGYLYSLSYAAGTAGRKLQDFLSVKGDFGAVGDGVTVDQSAVQAAVTAALAAGKPLYWNAGEYLLNTNINSFHDVEHFGPGRVTRTGNTFYISPKTTQTNTLYVSTTGSDSNDGFTSARAFATIQHACDIIAEWAPRLPGRWVIQLAAGTYTENVAVKSNTDSEFPIYIQGPDVTHPTVPTAIIAAADTAQPVFECNYGGHFVLVDVKLQGATTSDGFQTNGSRVTLTNVHIATCLNGLKALNGANVTAVGGIWTGRGSGIAGGIGYQGLYNVNHDIGGGSALTATQITAYERGLLVNEGTQGHLDYCQVSGCVTGLNIKRGAGACNTDNMTIGTCTTGVLVENNGWYNNNITFSSNTVNVRTLGGSPELSYLTASNSARTMRVIETTNIAAWTGSTGESTRWTSPSNPAWAVSQSGHVARVTIFGICTLTANCAVSMYINDGTTDTLLCTLNLTSVVTEFKADFNLWHSGESNQRAVLQLIGNGGFAPIVDFASNTVALRDLAFTLKAKVTLGNAANSITLSAVMFEATYGG